MLLILQLKMFFPLIFNYCSFSHTYLRSLFTQGNDIFHMFMPPVCGAGIRKQRHAGASCPDAEAADASVLFTFFFTKEALNAHLKQSFMVSYFVKCAETH